MTVLETAWPLLEWRVGLRHDVRKGRPPGDHAVHHCQPPLGVEPRRAHLDLHEVSIPRGLIHARHGLAGLPVPEPYA